jgi:hypothetical protein
MARIIGVSGSLRRGSFNTSLVCAAVELLPFSSESVTIRILLFVAVVLGALAPSAIRVRAQEATTPFVVGVWGQGGAVVVPFADFDGREWRTSWPAAVDTTERTFLPPPPLDQIPPTWWGSGTFSPTWEVVEPDGRRRSVRITRTTEAGMGSSCSLAVGIETDLIVGTHEPASVLASSRPGVITPVQTLTSRSAEWRIISEILPSIYQRYEPAVWKSERGSSRLEGALTQAHSRRRIHVGRGSGSICVLRVAS